MVRTGADTLYTGITTDTSRRVAEHSKGGRSGAKSLRSRGPVKLVYAASIGAHGLALKVEHRIKKLSKVRKEALVAAQPGRRALIQTLGLTGVK